MRRTCQTGAKAEHSEPIVRIRRGERLSDKSYPGDNRLVPPKRPQRRRSSAPRCRLKISWGWRSSQGFGCSPIKILRELGSDRRETGWSPIYCRRWILRRFAPSGPARALLLHIEICDDNVAITVKSTSPSVLEKNKQRSCLLNSLEDQKWWYDNTVGSLSSCQLIAISFQLFMTPYRLIPIRIKAKKKRLV